MSQAKHPGIAVVVDGQELIVPSLTVRQFKQHQEILTKPPAEGMDAATFMESRIPAIGDALRRNYPDITDDALLDKVDLANFRELVRAVQAASGMKVVKPGEVDPVAPESTGPGSSDR